MELWDSLDQCNAKEVLFVDSDPGKEDKQDESAVDFQPFSQAVTPVKIQTRGVTLAVVGIAVTAIAATVSVVQWIINQNWDNHQVNVHLKII